MSMTTANANSSFLPEQIGSLILRPIQTGSIALQVATLVNTAATENKFRVPIVATDPSAAWTGEGAEITPSDGTLDEAVTKYYKLAGLTIISRELANDSSPAAAQIVGDGLARDIATRLDAAFFSSILSPAANTPAGLGSIAANDIDAGAAWTNVDAFTEALYAAQGVGATLNAFVANPADALLLARLKEATASNRDLLQPDATAAGIRLIAGVPLLVSTAVEAGTVWGIPTAHTIVAMREDTTLDIDRSAYFSSDRVGIRAVLRVGWVFPHAAAIQKIALSA